MASAWVWAGAKYARMRSMTTAIGPVARQEIEADGVERPLTFDYHIDRSSWVALRILPSSHTNPIFVLVNDKPIRASRQSAEWCLKAVDQCWSQKSSHIRLEERGEA